MAATRSTVQERVQALGQCPLFADLSSKDKKSLASVMSLRTYKASDLLFYQGDRADGFFVIISGTIRVCRMGADGREQILHLMGAGDLVGEVPVFQGGKFPATAIADQSTQALYVPGNQFLKLGEANPHLLIELLAILSKRLRGFVQLIDDLALKEVSARLAKHLLDLQIRQGEPTVTLDCTKAMLAARLGTIAETLSRTLRKMQQKKLLQVQGKKITLLNTQGLQALAAGEKL